MKRKKQTKDQIAKKYGFKSGLEEAVAVQLLQNGEPGEYEEHTIVYTIPSKEHKYRPDFKLKNGIFIETKGRFTRADRQKHLYIKEQYPHLDIRFVFTNPNAKISKASSTSYGDWATKHGFLFSKGTIPGEWF